MRGARSVWVPVEHAVLQSGETVRLAEWSITLMRTSDGGPSCAVYTPAAEMIGGRYEDLKVTDATGRLAANTLLPRYREAGWKEYPNEDDLVTRG